MAKSIRFRSWVCKTIDLLDGWELSKSENLYYNSLIAVNGDSAVSFITDRKMMLVQFTFHPDMNFDKKQKFVRNIIRFPEGTSPEVCAREMKERFLPKVIEQTKTMRRLDD